jgi:protein SCO1/2
LAQVWNDYGVFREVVDGNSAAGYLVNHTARVTVIDQQGNLRVSFPFDTPVEDVVHDLNLLLKQ